MTQPLTPRDCDLRDFPRMMIDIPRLFASEFDSTDNDTAWRYGVTLWMKSFHQVPAASLPDDDRQLAKLCGLGRDVATWKAIREEALRGWTKADDGRLYHSVVAEMALECWLEKLAQRLSSGAGNAKRWNVEFSPAPIEADIEIGADCLERLNPKSRALAKVRRRKSPPETSRRPSGSDRDAGDIPSGSQGEGKGREEERANALSSAGAGESDLLGGLTPEAKRKPRRKPEVSIPDDYPDAAAITGAQEALRQKRANLDAGRLAERFRNHALQNDRRCRDWAAAWRNWVDKSEEGAPRLPGASTVAPTSSARFTGPLEVREALRVCCGVGPDIVRDYLDRCGWRDLPARTIVAPNGVVADRLKRDLGWKLREMGLEVVSEPAASAA